MAIQKSNILNIISPSINLQGFAEKKLKDVQNIFV